MFPRFAFELACRTLGGVILVAGEALIDMIPEGHSERPDLLRPAPGGSPFNVAVALGRLGLSPQFLCGFSKDAFGRMLLERLRDANVDLSLCLDSPALTTLGFVTEREGGHTDYAFYTEGTAGCSVDLDQLPVRLLPEVSAIHFGSFSLGVEPFGSALEALVMRESAQRVISVDPNIRPFLITNREVYLSRLQLFLERADLIKVSDEDLAWLQPGVEPADFAESALRKGVSIVVVTRGEAGALGFCPNGAIEVESPAVDVADTVGAGDTFQGALLAGLAERGRLTKAEIQRVDLGVLRELLDISVRAAAINCSRQGCDPPTRSELRQAVG